MSGAEHPAATKAPDGDARCRRPAGVVRPVIDRERCEGKADCLRVCPYDVFELNVLDHEQWRALSVRGKVKALVHGRRKAVAAQANRCRACGLCVAACPEGAIHLLRPDGAVP